MSTWKLTVWSRYRTDIDEVWKVKTDPELLADEFRPWLRFRVDDPDGLRRAIRETGEGTFRARLTGPLGLLGVPWPIVVEESHPPVFFRDRSSSLLLDRFEHRHRFEETPSGLVRYVDELTFTPSLSPSRLTALAVRQIFVRRHHRAARHLPVDRSAVARTWLRRLDLAVPIDVAPRVV